MTKNICEYSEKIFIPQLTQEEKKAIYHYSWDQFEEINHKLRTQQESQEAKLISQAIKKFQYDKPIRVYRKLRVSKTEMQKLVELCARGFIIDKAFQSTSLSLNGYKMTGNVYIDINIENPTVGAYIDPISYYKEQEYLLDQDTRIDIDYYSTNDQFMNIKGRVK